MRSVNYFRNRFEFAVKNSGTIKVNQNDITALNDLINWANGQGQNTQLEDSLLLFWVLSYWSVELENGKPQLNEQPKGFLEISDLRTVFDRLCTRLMPKDEVIKRIFEDLQLGQLANGIPLEKTISFDEVKNTLEKALDTVKSDFTPISQLKRCDKLIYKYPTGLTEGQRKMMGI
ncbi:hypothetical protein [Chryseobacterium sp. A321]